MKEVVLAKSHDELQHLYRIREFFKKASLAALTIGDIFLIAQILFVTGMLAVIFLIVGVVFLAGAVALFAVSAKYNKRIQTCRKQVGGESI